MAVFPTPAACPGGLLAPKGYVGFAFQNKAAWQLLLLLACPSTAALQPQGLAEVGNPPLRGRLGHGAGVSHRRHAGICRENLLWEQEELGEVAPGRDRGRILPEQWKAMGQVPLCELLREQGVAFSKASPRSVLCSCSLISSKALGHIIIATEEFKKVGA